MNETIFGMLKNGLILIGKRKKDMITDIYQVIPGRGGGQLMRFMTGLIEPTEEPEIPISELMTHPDMKPVNDLLNAYIEATTGIKTVKNMPKVSLN